MDYVIPTRINTRPWLTSFSLPELQDCVPSERIVLPICSLGTPAGELAKLAPLVLPPLYHEALTGDLKPALLDRIRQCFPYFEGTKSRADFRGEFEIVELPAADHPPPAKPKVAAFSVDTAVEEHGPHLPLATDTIQSYAVLSKIAGEFEHLQLAPPVEYGHLTWGLPFGLSIDITAPLLTRYVEGYTNAILDWMQPECLYVVDVHGSPVHRAAIEDGLRASRCENFAFRWLHEPLVEFAGDRGDQHAGGVETALIEHISKDLVDSRWWPERVDEIEAKEMTMDVAIELSSDMGRFIEHVEARGSNGIVGKIRNYFEIDDAEMFRRMVATAREDVRKFL